MSINLGYVAKGFVDRNRERKQEEFQVASLNLDKEKFAFEQTQHADLMDIKGKELAQKKTKNFTDRVSAFGTSLVKTAQHTPQIQWTDGEIPFEYRPWLIKQGIIKKAFSSDGSRKVMWEAGNLNSGAAESTKTIRNGLRDGSFGLSGLTTRNQVKFLTQAFPKLNVVDALAKYKTTRQRHIEKTNLKQLTAWLKSADQYDHRSIVQVHDNEGFATKYFGLLPNPAREDVLMKKLFGDGKEILPNYVRSNKAYRSLLLVDQINSNLQTIEGEATTAQFNKVQLKAKGLLDPHIAILRKSGPLKMSSTKGGSGTILFKISNFGAVQEAMKQTKNNPASKELLTLENISAAFPKLSAPAIKAGIDQGWFVAKKIAVSRYQPTLSSKIQNKSSSITAIFIEPEQKEQLFKIKTKAEADNLVNNVDLPKTAEVNRDTGETKAVDISRNFIEWSNPKSVSEAKFFRIDLLQKANPLKYKTSAYENMSLEAQPLLEALKVYENDPTQYGPVAEAFKEYYNNTENGSTRRAGKRDSYTDDEINKRITNAIGLRFLERTRQELQMMSVGDVLRLSESRPSIVRREPTTDEAQILKGARSISAKADIMIGQLNSLDEVRRTIGYIKISRKDLPSDKAFVFMKAVKNDPALRKALSNGTEQQKELLKEMDKLAQTVGAMDSAAIKTTYTKWKAFAKTLYSMLPEIANDIGLFQTSSDRKSFTDNSQIQIQSNIEKMFKVNSAEAFGGLSGILKGDRYRDRVQNLKNGDNLIRQHKVKVLDNLKRLPSFQNAVLSEMQAARNSLNTDEMQLARLKGQENQIKISMTYYYAGLVQGESGGRAISNEDFENIFNALWGGSPGGAYSTGGLEEARKVITGIINKANIDKTFLGYGQGSRLPDLLLDTKRHGTEYKRANRSQPININQTIQGMMDPASVSNLDTPPLFETFSVRTPSGDIRKVDVRSDAKNVALFRSIYNNVVSSAVDNVAEYVKRNPVTFDPFIMHTDIAQREQAEKARTDIYKQVIGSFIKGNVDLSEKITGQDHKIGDSDLNILNSFNIKDSNIKMGDLMQKILDGEVANDDENSTLLTFVQNIYLSTTATKGT